METQKLLEMLLKINAHQGHISSETHPSMKKYIWGVRNGKDIINLQYTVRNLLVAVDLVQRVYAEGGRVLYYMKDKNLMKLLEPVLKEKYAEKLGWQLVFISGSWKAGLLTQLGSEKNTSIVHPKSAHLKEKGNYSLELTAPDLLVSFSGLQMNDLWREAGIKNIPTIGLLDTNASAEKVNYPIPVNDDNYKCLFFLALLLLPLDLLFVKKKKNKFSQKKRKKRILMKYISRFKPKNTRSFKVKENVRARASLEKAALMKKKLKWGFLSKKFPQIFTLSKSLEERRIGSSPLTPSSMERLGRSFAISWESKQALKDHFLVKRENQWKSYGRKAKNGAWKRSIPLNPKTSTLPQEKLKFLSIWESRLDTCLWKSHLLPSILSARQWILHGFVLVNGKKVNKSSYILKKGDLVTFLKQQSTVWRKTYEDTLFFQKTPFPTFGLRPQLHPFHDKDFSFHLPPQHLEVHYTSCSFVFVQNPYEMGVENIVYPYPLNLSYLNLLHPIWPPLLMKTRAAKLLRGLLQICI